MKDTARVPEEGMTKAEASMEGWEDTILSQGAKGSPTTYDKGKI